ncbi:MAG: DUF6797 domain-containing protein, partial [Planctomycetaceae bacterium]
PDPVHDAELSEYRKHGIEYFAFWGVHDEAYRLFEKYDLHPQIWQTLESPPQAGQEEMVAAAVQKLIPLATRTQKMGCPLGLYNHGGWGGEPANLVAVCGRLRELGYDHVGIVYNFHHGHGHIQDWPQVFEMMLPYIICLNINGMNPNANPKILGIGKGAHELEMIRTVVQSDYTGPIGIIDHREQLDARDALQENLRGLEQVRSQLAADGKTPQLALSAPTAVVPSEPAKPSTGDAAYSPEKINQILADARQNGDGVRGAKVFADAKWACLSCHRVGQHGGTVGPELSGIAKQREAAHIVESVLWPQREVKPEYVVWQVLTSEGKALSGYKHHADAEQIVLRDPATGKLVEVRQEDIEAEVPGSTVMPSELTAAMSPEQQRDLFRFLCELGRDGAPLSAEIETVLRLAASHGPEEFPFEKAPLDPSRWTNSHRPINQHRLYDYYAKQAEYFRQQNFLPTLMPAFPGLEGEKAGHWGKQTDLDWEDGRWNETILGAAQAGVFHAEGMTIPRGICIRLGDQGELSTCFNPDTLTYDALWKGGFINFSSVRHGFMHGLPANGELLRRPEGQAPEQPFTYHGYYRYKNRIVFAYRIGEVEYLDSPWVENGEFVRERAPAESHSLRLALKGGPAQWPQVMETRIVPGEGRPYAIDTIELPVDNPWKSLIFCGDHDFLRDGSALVCTMQGDVWRVSGLESSVDSVGKARWQRFASGLHQALGLVVAEGQVYVQCRDQLTRLSDLNGDGEADFYECFSNAFQTSSAGHDFICGLQRDQHGNFYTASGNQGLIRISSDGKRADVIATGFRNPDGLGILPDGTLTVPCSEGEWTPASMICAVPLTRTKQADDKADQTPPHYGYRGPIANAAPEFPLAYLPRGIDNSSGGQAFIGHDSWGPFQNQMVHLSFGVGAWFVVLRDRVDDQWQGAVVPMAGDFLSGAHRGRFSPLDGQLYVSGMAGWGSYTSEDGCFQRVRYTGDPVQAPVDFHLYENGVRVTFAQAIDAAVAAKPGSHFAQCWNYRYSGAYGSPEFSPSHPGVAGHDALQIESVQLLPDERSLFLEIPELQPTSQLHLRMHVNEDDSFTAGPTGQGHDLFVTAHKLDRPFTAFEGYKPRTKTIAAHPLLSDIALNAKRTPNPFRQKIAGARTIKVQTGKNLTFATTEFAVKPNEPIEFVLINPDVVPHNWVLVQPNTLADVGELANQMIADPEAYARQYVPQSDHVLFHTDIVSPSERQAIYFHAPAKPGNYPFLCTFPGHWMVMNGVMVVK